MKNLFIESWEEYISFFKKLKTNKKKFVILLVLFELLVLILSGYFGFKYFKG